MEQTTAVIHVCVGPELAQSLDNLVQSVRWQISSASFDAYISAERRPSISPQMRSAELRIAFVNFDASPEQAAESARHLKQIFQGDITVVAVGQLRDPDLLLTAMRAGCSEFLQQPVAAEIVLETLRRLETSMDTARIQPKPIGQILSFFGSKGGVGTTTVAVHLAMYLAQCQRKRVLLIDNHPELGHVCVYLGLDGTHFHFQEVVRNVSRLDSELLRGYIARHSSGLDVLSSPEICGGLRLTDAGAIAQTLEFLRGEYDFVLIDSAMQLDDAAGVVIEASEQVYLVTTPEVGPMRDLARYLDALGQVDGVTDKLRIVLNRHPSPSAVTLEQVEAALGRSVAMKLPNSYTELVHTENLGQPLAPHSKSEFAAQVLRWSTSLAGPAAPVPSLKAKKSLFGPWNRSVAVVR
jgi:pilus assembly protein CpaE